MKEKGGNPKIKYAKLDTEGGEAEDKGGGGLCDIFVMPEIRIRKKLWTRTDFPRNSDCNFEFLFL